MDQSTFSCETDHSTFAEPTRVVRWDKQRDNADGLLTREWLVTNGLGGYASGTLAGVPTRRYHGLLIAALPTPHGRTMMLSQLFERVRLPNRSKVKLSGQKWRGESLDLHAAGQLAEFRLESGQPVWRYEIDDHVIEKMIVLPHGHNTVYVIFRLLEGPGPLRLRMQPSVHFRGHDDNVDAPVPQRVHMHILDNRFELSSDGAYPPLRIKLEGARPSFTIEARRMPEMMYRIEKSRGYTSQGDVWTPGYFRVDLRPGEDVALIGSAEEWSAVDALSSQDAQKLERDRRARLLCQAPAERRSGIAGELVLAADQFLVQPLGRTSDAARARASGDEPRTVIAGYHWFTDWGRDTMISLEGLTLCTGRHQEAGYILRTFANYIRDGLIPNLFPEGGNEGLYHTADATMWFFHAIDRYLAYTDDEQMLRTLIPQLIDIAEHHLRGTRFGIGVDPKDGLLRQGAEGYQLTWMDAKVGDWVVTPRRGKAVEINALWYNALRLLGDWVERLEGCEAATRWREEAARVRESFNRRFWYEAGGYLYDVVDAEHGGDDDACRPNQVFAISPRYSVLDRERWQPVIEVVTERLLTPMGLRSLAPGHPDYKPIYYGDLRARDAAYHQGTVWAWLIGPFIDAWLKVYPDNSGAARKFLAGFDDHMSEACIGSISEIFDAEAPFTPRGCIAQAWSVAEVLRAWVKTGARDTSTQREDAATHVSHAG